MTDRNSNEGKIERAQQILDRNPRMREWDSENVRHLIRCNLGARALNAALTGAARQRTPAEFSADQGEALQNSCRDGWEG